MMLETRVEKSEEAFIIRLVGLKPGVSPEQIEAVIVGLVSEKQKQRVGPALKKLPLILSRKASRDRASQIKQLLEANGGIVETAPVAAPANTAEKSVSPSAEKNSPILPRASSLESTPPVTPLETGPAGYDGPDRRARPRVHPGITLAPLGLGELLDRTFRLLRENFWLFFLIILIPQGSYFVVSSLLKFGLFGFSASQSGVGAGIAWGLSFVLVTLAFAVIQLWAQGALIYAVSEKYLGHLTSVGLAYRAARKRLWGLMGTILLMILLLGLLLALPGAILALIIPVLVKSGLPQALSILLSSIGFLCLFIVFFYFIINWLLMDKVVVLEKKSGLTALKRSKELMSARTGPGFWRSTKMKAGLILLCVFAIGIGFHLLFQIPGLMLLIFMKSSLIVQTLSEALGVLATSLATLMGAIAMILFYYDIRVRQEGFDLKMMAEYL